MIRQNSLIFFFFFLTTWHCRKCSYIYFPDAWGWVLCPGTKTSCVCSYLWTQIGLLSCFHLHHFACPIELPWLDLQEGGWGVGGWGGGHYKKAADGWSQVKRKERLSNKSGNYPFFNRVCGRKGHNYTRLMTGASDKPGSCSLRKTVMWGKFSSVVTLHWSLCHSLVFERFIKSGFFFVFVLFIFIAFKQWHWQGRNIRRKEVQYHNGRHDYRPVLHRWAVIGQSIFILDQH